jgi:hypothetical protein
MAVEKDKSLRLSCPPKPDGTDADSVSLFFINNDRQEEQRDGAVPKNYRHCFPKNYHAIRVVNFNSEVTRKLTTLKFLVLKNNGP